MWESLISSGYLSLLSYFFSDNDMFDTQSSLPANKFTFICSSLSELLNTQAILYTKPNEWFQTGNGIIKRLLMTI